MTAQHRLKFVEYLVFAIALVVLSIVFFHKSNHLFPSYIHAWTQSDRYALAQGFVMNKMDFFHPTTFNLKPQFEPQTPVGQEQGITSVDFPIIEYCVAFLMKTTGSVEPFFFRLFVLIIGIVGLFFLFSFCRKLGNSFFYSLILTIFVFVSPVYTYYFNGFIPTSSAVAFCFIAFYFYYSFLDSKKFKFYILTLTFLCLASLIRMPFLIPLIAVVLTQFFANLKNKKNLRKELLTSLIFFIIFLIYFFYNQHLKNKYGSLFINNLMLGKNIKETFSSIETALTNWKFSYFSLPQYFIVIFGFFAAIKMLLKNKNRNISSLIFCTTLWIFASIAYLFVMAKQFPNHDYYFLDSFFVPLVLLVIIGISAFCKKTKKIEISVGAIILVVAILSFIKSYQVQKERYTFKNYDLYEIAHRNYEDVDKLLDRVGVGKNENIVILDANTTNVALMLADRRGYTVRHSTEENIRTSLNYNANWYLVQNRFLASDILRNMPSITQELDFVGTNNRISVFKKQKNDGAQSLIEILKLEYVINENLPLETQKLNQFFSDNNQYLNAEFITLADTLVSNMIQGAAVLETKISRKDFPIEQLFLTIDISNSDDYKYYDNFPLNLFFENNDSTVVASTFMNIPDFSGENYQIKCYIWNPKLYQLQFKDLKFSIIDKTFLSNLKCYE